MNTIKNIGSFRGAEFWIEGSDRVGGRNIVVHEFPQEQPPIVDDLSPKAKRFRIDCWVIGPRYIEDRDALISAVEAPGSGTLVHPYYGRLEVYVDGDYTIQERRSAKGKASFSIPFVLASEIEGLHVQENTDDNVKATAAAAHQAAVDSFAAEFDVAKQPGWVAQAAQDVVNASTGVIADVIKPIAMAKTAAATLQANVEALQGAVESLIYAPKELATQLVSIADSILELADSPAIASIAYKAFLFPVYPSPGGPQSVVQSRIDKNKTAFLALMKRIATASSAKAYMAMTLTTNSQAKNISSQIETAANEIAYESADDEIIDDFQRLQTDVSEYTISVLPGLLRIVNYIVPQDTNTLALAAELYGDLGRETEIIALNDIIDPSRIPAGTILEVVNV